MKFKLINPSPGKGIQNPVTIGIPCPKGKVLPDSNLVAECHGETLPLQTAPLTVWPDKSIKWLLCDFLVDLDPNEERTVTIIPVDTGKKSLRQLTYKHQGNRVTVTTGAARFELNTSTLLPFQQVRVGGQDTIAATGTEIRLIQDENGSKLPAIIDDISIEAKGPVRLTLNVTGHFGKDRCVLFQARLHFYAGSAKTCLEFTLHNPKAARHPGGIWDLGDPSSFLFKELALSLPLSETERTATLFKPAPEKQWQKCDQGTTLKIYQESSGGEYWDSPNHRNRHGQVPMKIRGYHVLSDNKILEQGNRCQPIFWAGYGTTGLSVVVPQFWQQFPKALKLNKNKLDIALYPGCFPDLHELQGGEQKTHMVYFDFAADQNHAGWGLTPVQVVFDPATINESGIFKDVMCGEPATAPYQDYLKAAIEGKDSFFAKREVIDEYGWRNFGEIYADHEAVFHSGDKPFVSHYNNQYDAIASFYREFFHTGDPRWAELAGDLARHVRDIDLNHTDQDREEYCHGLFWHTDHYLDAGLSTHRSVSAEHLAKKNPAFVGGGPGAQHCYSTGLMFHYLLTGNPLFRDAVIQLADWSYLSLRRPQTLLAALLRGWQALRALRQMKDGSAVCSRFPLTRGTGNCLNASLDAYELTGLKAYLVTAGDLIRGTVHPSDDINKRDLLNAEDSWCYSVFLLAVCKFLETKYAAEEIDDDFLYARDSLLHYVNWMADNERPYLDHAELLEYPNETWAAQELRKSVIFFHAAKYTDNTQHRENMLAMSRFFVEAGFSELASRDTRFLSRPLVLVLQNGWVADCAGKKNSPDVVLSVLDKGKKEWGPSPFAFTFPEVMRRFFSDIINCTAGTSLKREWAWLKARIVR